MKEKSHLEHKCLILQHCLGCSATDGHRKIAKMKLVKRHNNIQLFITAARDMSMESISVACLTHRYGYVPRKSHQRCGAELLM